jgi:hypothetical protein
MYQQQTVREANESLVASMFEELAAALPGTPNATTESLVNRHRQLVTEHAHLAGEDEMAQGHVVFATGLLAGFEHARRHLSTDEALKLVRDSMLAPVAEAIREGTRQALDHAEDPFDTMVGFAREREKDYFGPSSASSTSGTTQRPTTCWSTAASTTGS